jgi:two-component system OmpR family sensor kinase
VLRLAADLALAAAAASVAWLLLAPPRSAFFDPRTTHLALDVATVVTAGAIVVLGVLGCRALRHPRPAWVGAAFGLYGAVAVFPTALGPRALHDTPGLLASIAAADLAVVLVLLVAPRPPSRPGAWGAWAAAAFGGVLAVMVPAAGPAAVHVLASRPVQAVTTLGWVLVTLIGLVTGYRRRQLVTSRVAVGFALLAAAHVHRFVVGSGLAEPDLLFNGLELLGVIGVLAGCAGRLRDEVSVLMSEREEQRLELREAARHAQRAAELAHDRDHELANGLAGLSGIAFLLDQPTAGVDARALRSVALAELSRLHGLLGGGPRDTSSGVYDAADVVSELGVMRRAAGMDLDVTTDRDLPVQGRRDALAQVLVNLLGNCERHAPGSPVRISARRCETSVVVEVRDEGPGIPGGAERTVLQRGVSVGDTGGSGLGLAVIARVVDEQGGGLRVLAREPDRPGFAVRVELPIADETPRSLRGEH